MTRASSDSRWACRQRRGARAAWRRRATLTARGAGGAGRATHRAEVAGRRRRRSRGEEGDEDGNRDGIREEDRNYDWSGMVLIWHGSNFNNFQWHIADTTNSSSIFFNLANYSGIDPINPKILQPGPSMFK